MFSKLAVLFAAAAVVAAVPAPGGEPAPGTPVFNTTTNKCNVGKLQCCQSIQTSKSDANQQLAGLVGVALGALQVPIGVTCTPISALIGVGAGANCNATPVCCKQNNFNGVVAGGCLPINANL